MIDIKQLSGIMNTDDSEVVIGATHHKMGRNIRFRGMPANMRAESVPGTTLIPNSFLPDTGTNQCIGAFFDSVKQRIFFAEHNSLGKHGWYQYDIASATFSKLLQCFTDSAGDILGFSLDFPIASINILYTSVDVGDIIHWCARNNRPMKLNVQDAINGLYGSLWIEDYLTVARPMPLIPPLTVYKDDTTVNINNLRKKLYEFRYRWINKDLTTSTWSPYSKLISPANPDDITADINEQKNNRIDVTVNSGGADVLKVEIAFRLSLGDGNFDKDQSLITLVKSDLVVGDNTNFTYEFFNDASYPYTDERESLLVHDYVPKVSNCQELLNGNVPVYGGILEGYNWDGVLDVSLAVSMVPFSTVAALTIDIIFQGKGFEPNPSPPPPQTPIWYNTLRVQGTPTAGDIYTLIFKLDDNPLTTVTITYTAVFGNTATDVATGLKNAWIATATTSTRATSSGINLSIDGVERVLTLISISYAYASSSQPADGVANSIYKHKSKYAFGLVYFDKFGWPIAHNVYTNSDLLFETPEVTTTGQSATDIPKITATINHEPPEDAYSFSWVRTPNLSVASLLSTVSCKTYKEIGKYGYLEITNQQKNQNNFPVYDFKSGDRVRIIGVYGSALGTVYDFPLQSYSVDPKINGATVTGSFILVPYDSVLVNFGTAGNDHYLIEIYTPPTNISLSEQVYFEFGESYPILNPTTSFRSHAGKTQDQILGTQPAIYEFFRGDFYIKERKIPFDASLAASSVNTVWIIDTSVADLFPSKIVGNGRSFIVDKNGGEVYFPTELRWGLAYQQDTSVNQTNRFYFENSDEIDRQFGDIQRFKVRDRIMRIFQNRRCGQVGVYTKFIQDSGGNNTLTTTDEIITSNNVQYYEGEFGLGDAYTSLTSAAIQDYYPDPVRGYQVRLSQDGNTPISELYKGQYYIRSLILPYANGYLRPDGSKAKILGVYDYVEEQYHCLLQGGRTAHDPLILATNEVALGIFYVAFSGTPVAGDIITIYCENTDAATGTFIYTVLGTDTIATIRATLVALINANPKFHATATTIDGNLGINIQAIGVTLEMSVNSIASLVYPMQVANYNWSFNEPRNAYTGFYDWNPEWVLSVNGLVYYWVAGVMYVLNNETTWCKFNGTQFSPSITLVFNKEEAVRKTFNSLSYQSNKFWQSPANGDVYTSEFNQYTGFQQQSQLKTVDFADRGNYKDAAFLRDANSSSNAAVALLEGDYLSGQWIVTKLTYSGSDFVFLFSPYILYQPNQRNF